MLWRADSNPLNIWPEALEPGVGTRASDPGLRARGCALDPVLSWTLACKGPFETSREGEYRTLSPPSEKTDRLCSPTGGPAGVPGPEALGTSAPGALR